MPSEKQQTLIHTIPVTEFDKGSSATSRLRQSYSSHLNSIVRQNATSRYDSGLHEVPVDVNLHVEDEADGSLKKFYADTVMRGQKNIKGSGFPAVGLGGGVSLDYEDAPSLGSTGPTPEGESAPGNIGSSIHSSGLGPNVNIHGTLGADGTRQVVDAAPTSDTPFEGSGNKEPSDSTVYNAGGNIPAGLMGISEETVTG